MSTPTRLAVRAVSVLAATFIASTGAAQSFPEMGARAMSMGGAYVAVAEGPTANFWNPAANGVNIPSGSFVFARSTTDPEGLSDRLDDLAATRATADDIAQRPSDGLRAAGLLSAIAAESDPVGGRQPLGVFYSGNNYGFAAYRMRIVDATPQVDTIRVGLTDDPDTSIRFNDSRLTLTELYLTDYVVSTGFPIGDQRTLVGVSARWTRGQARTSAPTLFGFPGFQPNDVFGEAKQGEDGETSNEFSFDTGVMLNYSKVRFGLVGKYLGAPEFETAQGRTLKLDPRWRTGIAILPTPSFTLSADLDLTATSLAPDARDSRHGAVGFEVRLLEQQLALRGGWREPLEGPDDGRLLTAGVGFAHAAGFFVDAGFGYGSRNDSLSLTIELGMRQVKRGPYVPKPRRK